MKLTKFKGIAHDLAHYLGFEIWFGYWKDLPKSINSNVLEKKNSFDRMCVKFFEERLPSSFDFQRIKKINVSVERTRTTLTIAIKVKVDNKEFSYKSMSVLLTLTNDSFSKKKPKKANSSYLL